MDTHIQHICARLGLIGPKDSAEKAQRLLEAALQVLHAEQDTCAMHVDMIRHGRQICRAQRPRCMQCPLRDLCLYGSTVAARVS